MTVKFTNNASTTLASGINTTATSITVADASSFPSLSGADDYAYLTLQQSTGTGREIVKATALSSNTFTVVRAQDNTTARTHSSGDIVELRLTSALLTDVINAATVEGIKTNFQYTPTAGQTVFTGADNSSNTLVINDSSLINVYLNGARLVQGTDYTVDVNNNRVTLASGGTTADILDIEVFGNFTGQSGAAVAITGGAITGATIDNAVIGGSTAAAGTFTTITGALASSVTGSTQSQGSNNTLIATTAYVDTAVSNLIDSAPSSLNTLNELAAAMNDNASFFSTVLPLSGGTMTGNISHASDFTLDMGGEINLDADGGKIRFKDAGTEHLRFVMDNSGALQMYAAVADVDLKIQGLDGSSVIDALTLDMENAGKATFNAGGAFNDDVSVFGTDSKLFVGESGAGGTFGFLGWNDASNYLFLGNSYNSAFNTDIVISSTGKVGIGNVPTDGTLHVLTASAGTVSASTQADDLVVENNAETGITIISPDDQSARIRFTSPSTNTDVGGASIFYRQNINKMNIGTNVAGGILALHSGAASETMRLDANRHVGIGISPAVRFHVDVGAPSSTDQTLGLFQSQSSRQIGFVWDDSQSTLGVATLTNHSLVFHTGGNSNERMRIDTSGNTTFTGQVTATKLTSTNGVLELDDNGSHNGVINAPAALYLNIDSDSNSSGEALVVGKDRTSTTGGTEILRVNESKEIQIGGTSDASFIDFDGNKLQLNTQRNPNSGSFVNTSKSHASIELDGANGGSAINFRTTGSNNTASSLRWTIQSNGHLRAATDGVGINFDAAESSTATSTVLDDYEEGSHAPTVTGSAGGSFTLAGAGNSYSYTKIGRTVHVQGYLSITGGSGSGSLRISMPFTAASLTDDQGYSFGSALVQNNGTTVVGQKYSFVSDGADYFDIYQVNDAGSAAGFQAGDCDTNFQIGFNFSFIAS